MATQTFTPNLAKRWMKYASSFKNDDRCEDVVYVTGADYQEVLTRTKELHSIYAEGVDKITDYDVNYDNVGDCYVGVVCVSTSSGMYVNLSASSITGSSNTTYFNLSTGGTLTASLQVGKTNNEVPGQMAFDEVVSNEFVSTDGRVWEVCCEHCECGEGERLGHDDTCEWGCND